jgi:aryl-alcohol dehydrogenase-like predicted oxidoreductase
MNFGPETSEAESFRIMDQALAHGVNFFDTADIGSSNFAGWHIARANESAQRRNFLGLVAEQSLYNLNARTVELEVLPPVRPMAWA